MQMLLTRSEIKGVSMAASHSALVSWRTSSGLHEWGPDITKRFDLHLDVAARRQDQMPDSAT